MEPKDYPDNDPGPYTLMADGQPQDTTQRLQWLLSRATGYFGVTNYLGSRFLASDGESPRCRRNTSVNWKPTVNTGFNDVIGSWKIIEISAPRSRRSSG